MANEIEDKVTASAETPEVGAAASTRKSEGRPQRRNDQRRNDRREREVEQDEFEERTIVVNRFTKVVKVGKNFSFSALIAVGDKKGRVGLGFGKANELSDAIRKGGEHARKNLMAVPTRGTTITHAVEARFCAAKVLIKPASQGTGVIAGGAVRPVLECAGIQDVLSKSLGSDNAINVVHATVDALKQLVRPEEVAARRGKTIEEVAPAGMLRARAGQGA